MIDARDIILSGFYKKNGGIAELCTNQAKRKK